MATYFSGEGNILTAGQSIYAESSSQVHTLGARLCLGDGRVFHYAKWGGTMVAGQLAAAAQHVANHHDLRLYSACAAGSRTVTVTLGATAATANQYKDGLLFVIAGTGIGQTYKIKSNPAADASATCAFTLYDEVVTALSTSDSDIDVIPNLFNGVTHSATEEYLHLGVPLIAGTSGYYGWLQTWGPVGVFAGDTAANGTLLMAGDTAGETLTQDGYTKSFVGEVFGATHASGEYNATYLRLVP